MRKIICLMTAVFVLGAVPVYAGCEFCKFHKSMSSEDWLAKKMEKMTSSLELTEEQIPQVKKLIEEKIKRKQAIFEKSMDDIEMIKEEYSAKIQELLSDEQKVQYEAMQKEWKEDSMKGSSYEHKGSGHEMKGSGSEMMGSDSEEK